MSENSSQELRFDRAEGPNEASSPTCSVCETLLHDVYFEINGRQTCERCRYEVERVRSEGSAPGRFLKACFAGSVAALIGAGIYYAVLALTGYEIGLIAIVVGLLVGGAVRWGSSGRGGWVYQGLAISLTYMAIVSTYVPFIFEAAKDEAAREQQGEQPQNARDDLSSASDASTSTSTDSGDESLPSAGEIVLSLALFAGLVMAVPFLAGVQNIIGILIIGFALYEAWRLNRAQSLEIAGPYHIRSGTKPVSS